MSMECLTAVHLVLHAVVQQRKHIVFLKTQKNQVAKVYLVMRVQIVLSALNAQVGTTSNVLFFLIIY